MFPVSAAVEEQPGEEEKSQLRILPIPSDPAADHCVTQSPAVKVPGTLEPSSSVARCDHSSERHPQTGTCDKEEPGVPVCVA